MHYYDPREPSTRDKSSSTALSLGVASGGAADRESWVVTQALCAASYHISPVISAKRPGEARTRVGNPPVRAGRVRRPLVVQLLKGAPGHSAKSPRCIGRRQPSLEVDGYTAMLCRSPYSSTVLRPPPLPQAMQALSRLRSSRNRRRIIGGPGGVLLLAGAVPPTGAPWAEAGVNLGATQRSAYSCSASSHGRLPRGRCRNPRAYAVVGVRRASTAVPIPLNLFPAVGDWGCQCLLPGDRGPVHTIGARRKSNHCGGRCTGLSQCGSIGA